MTENTSNSDQVYWKLLKDGDASALGYLYDRYVDRLFICALRITRNRELAKDAIQEIFVQLWKYRASIGDITYPQSYLLKMLTRNLAKDLKKEKYINVFTIEDTLISSDANVEDLMVSKDSSNEKKHLLQFALRKLTKRQKILLQLHFYDGLSYKEIAKKLRMNQQSVSNLAFRTIVRLRDFIAASASN